MALLTVVFLTLLGAHRNVVWESWFACVCKYVPPALVGAEVGGRSCPVVFLYGGALLWPHKILRHSRLAHTFLCDDLG